MSISTLTLTPKHPPHTHIPVLRALELITTASEVFNTASDAVAVSQGLTPMPTAQGRQEMTLFDDELDMPAAPAPTQHQLTYAEQ